jgi:hypothetical protein
MLFNHINLESHWGFFNMDQDSPAVTPENQQNGESNQEENHSDQGDREPSSPENEKTCRRWIRLEKRLVRESKN